MTQCNISVFSTVYFFVYTGDNKARGVSLKKKKASGLNSFGRINLKHVLLKSSTSTWKIVSLQLFTGYLSRNDKLDQLQKQSLCTRSSIVAVTLISCCLLSLSAPRCFCHSLVRMHPVSMLEVLFIQNKTCGIKPPV